MREIKFRAWDRKAKAMFPVHNMEFGKIGNSLDRVYGVDIHHKDSDFEGDISFGGNVNKMTGNPLQQRFELMQYTGLKDRNGVEIYEGDILDGSWINPMSQEKVTRHYKITFDKGKYNAELIGRHPYGSTMLYFENEKGEVIGNIYEHPHLLEGA